MRDPGPGGASAGGTLATPSSSCDSLPLLMNASSAQLHRVGSQQDVQAPGSGLPKSRVGERPCTVGLFGGLLPQLLHSVCSTACMPRGSVQSIEPPRVR